MEIVTTNTILVSPIETRDNNYKVVYCILGCKSFQHWDKTYFCMNTMQAYKVYCSWRNKLALSGLGKCKC